ncbi:hypothetical protein [Ramlibacter albus]|uniref:Uncharacterized protein n=1 Tax=Ramlibacter albus TaxID=2079448 RepID=A0A923M2R8_9BURK|nr:hypothetical protein [Ramlibacter albus]MBC5763077.1 hypothetical protein [Ramlibacter albus]
MARQRPLVLREVPFELPDLQIELFQSKKTQSDPAISWAAANIRQSILELFRQTCDEFGEGWAPT